MDLYVNLAKHTIESYVREKEIYEPKKSELTDEMIQSRSGAFVSIHKNGQLRGCIGTIQATQDCLGAEIIMNAISAATRDPRFFPIEEEELEDLEIHVDVLKEREKISSSKELDVKRYGVIVEKGMKRGLLLPDLEGVDTVDEQIAIAKMKANISEEEEDISLYRFEVIRHE